MAKCYHSAGWPEEANWINYYSLNRDSFLLPWPQPHIHGCPSSSASVEGTAEERATTASKSHSQAEKRRRERINAQLATLRKLIPRSDKMDKAALLGSVVDHVKDLKRKAIEIGQVFTIPTEVDEVIIDCDRNVDTTNNPKKENQFIKASICCDDRPELFEDLNRALKGLRLTTVRAEMATLGGRVINVMILCTKDCKESVCLNSLKQSLKIVLSRIAVSSSVASTSRCPSKRQRFLLPSHYSQ